MYAQLDSDQSVSGSDASCRVRSDSYADELPTTDDCTSTSSTVFRENGDLQPSEPLSSETNNNTISQVRYFVAFYFCFFVFCIHLMYIGPMSLVTSVRINTIFSVYIHALEIEFTKFCR